MQNNYNHFKNERHWDFCGILEFSLKYALLVNNLNSLNHLKNTLPWLGVGQLHTWQVSWHFPGTTYLLGLESLTWKHTDKRDETSFLRCVQLSGLCEGLLVVCYIKH